MRKLVQVAVAMACAFVFVKFVWVSEILPYVGRSSPLHTEGSHLIVFFTVAAVLWELLSWLEQKNSGTVYAPHKGSVENQRLVKEPKEKPSPKSQELERHQNVSTVLLILWPASLNWCQV